MKSCVVFAVLVVLTAGKPYNSEQRLHVDLFKDYDYEIRPVKKDSDKLTVSLGMTAVAIIGSNDENDDVFKLKSFIIMAWQDDRLKWNSSAYDGVKNTRIPYKKVWRPDITLYNSASADSVTPTFDDTMVLIHSNGTVLYVPPVIAAVPCKTEYNLNTAERECSFTFGSWTYDGNKIDLQFYEGKKKVDVSMLYPSDEWKIKSTSAKREVKHYPCCPEPYPDITYTIKMKSTYNKNSPSPFGAL